MTQKVDLSNPNLASFWDMDVQFVEYFVSFHKNCLCIIIKVRDCLYVAFRDFSLNQRTSTLKSTYSRLPNKQPCTLTYRFLKFFPCCEFLVLETMYLLYIIEIPHTFMYSKKNPLDIRLSDDSLIWKPRVST